MEKKRIPKRRFREFLEAGEWKDFSFGTLVERKSTMMTGVSLPILEYEDLISGSGELDKDITQKSGNKTGIFFQEGDIVYGKLRPYLKNWYLPAFDGIAVGDFWVFRSQNIAPTFIYGLIQTPRYETVANQSIGTKMPRADWHVVSDTSFFVPMDYCEQKKIGDFCRRLDALISLHQQKLSKLKDLKQAYLTEMFPAPGEKRPRRRFKGFSGDWERKSIGEIAHSVDTGKSVFYSKTKGIYAVLGSTSVIGYDTSYDYEGDFLLTARVGANAGNMYRYSGKVKISDNTVFLEAENIDFLYYALDSYDLRKLSFGTGQPLVKASDLKNLNIMIPKSVEQKRIGDFFTRIDNSLYSCQDKLNKLQSLKQAYLSELFV